MTVRQLMEELSDLPEDAYDSEVTDVSGNPVCEVNFSNNPYRPGVIDVWLTTTYLYDAHYILRREYK